MQTEVSVLIVTYNSARQIDACLDALARGADVALEVIAVDNASGDGTAEKLARAAGVHLVVNGCNRGFAAAINQAARLAHGRYLLLLNPDTQVQPGALRRLLDFLQRHPAVGICAPRLVDMDGRIRHNCFGFETPWSFFAFGVGVGPLRWLRRLALGGNRWDITADAALEVEAVTGAAMLVRRDLFEAFGGLDERFFMYCEDGDFCLRTARNGWKTVLVPCAVVIHVGGASTQAGTPLLNGMIGRHLLQSRYAYTRKYWGSGAMWALRLAYGGAGIGFLLAGALARTPAQRSRLLRHGRLLLLTAPLRQPVP